MVKILVVDDNLSDLKTMKKALESKKYKVMTAVDGAHAIDLVRAQKFDLFLIDIRMPTFSGYDLVRLLRERYNGQSKIILVSIIYDEEIKSTDVDGFIKKPFSPEDLISEVEKVLSGE